MLLNILGHDIIIIMSMSNGKIEFYIDEIRMW